jgi:GNAT superfamily N-acetyltransferase
MKILDYSPDHLPELAALYNDLTRAVPHCYPALAQELAGAIAGEYGLESSGQHLAVESVFLASDGELLGFVHVGERDQPRKENGEEDGEEEESGGSSTGVIRFLGYRRGCRDAGQALLETAENWFRERQISSVTVFPQAFRYPFYGFAHISISDRLDHVQALFFNNGYSVSEGEYVLDWPNFDPVFPEAPAGFDVDIYAQRTPSSGALPDVTLKAHLDDEQIGECVFIGASAFSRREEAQSWAFCNWLGVEEPYRRRGLGLYLLRLALVEVHDAGYIHAAISTALENYRALLFYTNYGFHVVDTTRQFSRQLPENG